VGDSVGYAAVGGVVSVGVMGGDIFVGVMGGVVSVGVMGGDISVILVSIVVCVGGFCAAFSPKNVATYTTPNVTAIDAIRIATLVE